MKLIEVAGSKGEQLMSFTNYVMMATDIDEETGKLYSKIGTALIKGGFDYSPAEFSLLPDDEDGVFEVFFPSFRDEERIKLGRFRAHYYTFLKGKKYEFDRDMSASKVATWTAEQLKDYMKQKAQYVD